MSGKGHSWSADVGIDRSNGIVTELMRATEVRERAERESERRAVGASSEEVEMGGWEQGE